MTIKFNFFFIFAVLLVLKMTVCPDLGWLWVLLPILLPLGVLCFFGLLVLIVMFFKLMNLKL